MHEAPVTIDPPELDLGLELAKASGQQTFEEQKARGMEVAVADGLAGEERLKEERARRKRYA
ncbi:MAG: hypothetical protein COA42_13785 [Alteromonadaceae bacterium]|nr:MAG: hypothetical protein COA42_13785 [Alteromonadaceae bacterium]